MKTSIAIGIIIILGILIIGYNYWGWFGKVGSNGFPTNPKYGDKYTKDGIKYVFKEMVINCITTPCPQGVWVPFN